MSTIHDQEKARRLLLVATKLDVVPDELFNFESWVGDDWKGLDDLSCGTTACGLGWATTIPELKELGLCLRLVPYRVYDGEPLESDHPRHDRLRGTVSLKSLTDEKLTPINHAAKAACEIFGVTKAEFWHLFTPDHCIYIQGVLVYGVGEGDRQPTTAKQLAAHIRQFVKLRFPEIDHATLSPVS